MAGPINLIMERLHPLGIFDVGVADLTGVGDGLERDRKELIGDLCRAVVIGIQLPRAVLDTLTDRPTPLYMHTYRQANYALDRATMRLAILFQELGARALPVPASQITAKNPFPRGALSHRQLGRMAGMGWIGINNLLVHPVYGSQWRLASLLTDLDLDPTGKELESRCRQCMACVECCPAGAIKPDHAGFDAQACHEKLLEFRKLPGVGQEICGLCVKPCKGFEKRGPCL